MSPPNNMAANDTFSCINPADGSVVTERRFASNADIEQALARAARAQTEWRFTPVETRAQICRRAVQYFLDHADDIGQELTLQMGRPIRYTPNEIRRGFQERAGYMIGQAATALADLEIENSAQFRRFIRR